MSCPSLSWWGPRSSTPRMAINIVHLAWRIHYRALDIPHNWWVSSLWLTSNQFINHLQNPSCLSDLGYWKYTCWHTATIKQLSLASTRAWADACFKIRVPGGRSTYTVGTGAPQLVINQQCLINPLIMVDHCHELRLTIIVNIGVPPFMNSLHRLVNVAHPISSGQPMAMAAWCIPQEWDIHVNESIIFLVSHSLCVVKLPTEWLVIKHCRPPFIVINNHDEPILVDQPRSLFPHTNDYHKSWRITKN